MVRVEEITGVLCDRKVRHTEQGKTQVSHYDGAPMYDAWKGSI